MGGGGEVREGYVSVQEASTWVLEHVAISHNFHGGCVLQRLPL